MFVLERVTKLADEPLENIKVGDLVVSLTSQKEYYLVLEERHYLQFPYKTYVIRSLKESHRTREVAETAIERVSDPSSGKLPNQ